MIASLRILAAALLIAGCALTHQLPQPQQQPTAEPAIPIQADTSRVFHEFAAVIVQPKDSLSSLAARYLGDSSKDWIISEFNGVTSVKPGQPIVIPLVPLGKGGVTPEGYQTVSVLSYHKFSRDKVDLTTVSEKAFDDQMRFLKRNGYRVITMDQFFDFLEFKNQIPEKSVLITIDDGWRSVYDLAFPILKKYGYPATFFIYTDFIINGSRTLDWNILKEMSDSGISIQCHTKTHRYLDRRIGGESFKDYFESIKKDLIESTKVIKQRLNSDVKYLAYPYGETNHLVITLLMKLGYRGAFTVERGGNPFFVNPYRANRSMIYGTFSMKDFENNLKTLDDRAIK